MWCTIFAVAPPHSNTKNCTGMCVHVHTQQESVNMSTISKQDNSMRFAVSMPKLDNNERRRNKSCGSPYILRSICDSELKSQKSTAKPIIYKD